MSVEDGHCAPTTTEVEERTGLSAVSAAALNQRPLFAVPGSAVAYCAQSACRLARALRATAEPHLLLGRPTLAF